MAYLPLEFSKPGKPIEIEIRGKRYSAMTTIKPLYVKPAATPLA
jgi:glycine cleavage system aminomethyltransferase T